MKVLLLGATGNVGSRALPALIKHGHTVVAYVRSPSKLAPDKRAVLADVVVGSVLDKSALKAAILAHDCDAVFHAAGVAQMLGRSKTGEYNRAFAAVVAAIVEAREERSGPAIRAWLMSGFPVLDSAVPGRLIGDYMPMFPEHKENLALIRKQNEGDIAWSLFCANQMSPKHKEIRIPPPDDCSAANVVANADSPPEWRDTLKWVPLLGPYLNVFGLAGGYATSLEDPMDFIATDLEKGLQSEFVGKRVGLKMKKA
ncbi:NAD(P)-binding protein [Lentithecium fluviatile CBS 122367]|uniref:NAD(P)-binding protein n=1 Tax=Lentithecium fluviatile CBS 122367 TaxID=1168545 RepID=A0A6G1IBT4_9PLEO|nr:NAD(P)-binding protein [Lentithecium fluviatile CBS 122367]